MMWLSMASMIMLFAGFTSAYLVKRGDTNVWRSIDLPKLFWVSTTLILFSSFTMHMAVRSFRKNLVGAYRQWVLATTVLGLGFLISQVFAWSELTESVNVLTRDMVFATDNIMGRVIHADYLWVISGAHFVHVGAGIICLLGLVIVAFRKFRTPEDTLLVNVNPDKVAGVELVATFWHFIDILWIYLFIFFIVNI